MLEDKVCLVTGGGRGLGQAICEVLSEAGCTVVAADIHEETARQTAEKLSRPGRGVLLDVTNDEQAVRVISDIAAEFGRIDVCVAAGHFRAHVAEALETARRLGSSPLESRSATTELA